MNAILISSIWGVLILIISLWQKNRKAIFLISLIGLIILWIANYYQFNGSNLINWSSDFIQTSNASLFYMLLIIGFSILYFMLNKSAFEEIPKFTNEIYVLLFFVLTGSCILAFFDNLLMLFLGLEILSLPLYILTGIDQRNVLGIEASLKYFLMGAFFTGILLLGIAFIYGSNGTFYLTILTKNSNAIPSFLLAAGVILVVISLIFKIGAAPFHFWAPDVYEGSPTVITGFMASIVKMVAIFTLIKFLTFMRGSLGETYQLLLIFIIVASLIVGNITALFQQSFKRLMAYSSIGQAGYMMCILLLKGNDSNETLWLYTCSYILANIGIFTVLNKVQEYSFSHFKGFAKNNPFAAFVLAVCLLSMAGIPLTAGFMAKLFLLKNLLHVGSYLWLAILIVLFSVIGLSYYLRLIQVMYFKKNDDDAQPALSLSFNTGAKIGLICVLVAIVLLGIFPYSLFSLYYFN